ncbi:MAG: M48 family metalloprotease [Pseudomonadota bacterium]
MFINKKLMLIFVAVAFLCFASSVDTVKVKRKYAKVRNGPASFYPVVSLVYQNDSLNVVKATDKWLNISFEKDAAGFVKESDYLLYKKEKISTPVYKEASDASRKINYLDNNLSFSTKKKDDSWREVQIKKKIEGWVARISIAEKSSGFDMKNLLQDIDQIPISEVETAAAIRGLTDSFSSIKDYNFKALKEILEKELFSVDSYNASFRDPLQKHINAPKKKKIKQMVKEILDPIYEERLGYLVAAHLLGKYKIVAVDSELSKYVNMLGTFIAFYSERYDVKYRFLILKSDELNSFSAPGGFVFLTTGVLEKVTSEDELAAILGHEISHIALAHSAKSQRNTAARLGGMDVHVLEADFDKEIKKAHKRQDYEGGDLAYANKEVFQKLSHDSNLFLDATIGGGRNYQFEIEADFYGQYYAYIAGFGTNGMLKFLDKIKGKNENYISQKSIRDFMNHPDVPTRIKELERNLKRNGLYKINGYEGQSRFMEYKKQLNLL